MRFRTALLMTAIWAVSVLPALAETDAALFTLHLSGVDNGAVTVTVTAENAADVGGLSLAIKYGGDVTCADSVKSSLKGAIAQDLPEQGKVMLLWDTVDGGESFDGAIFTAKLNVDEAMFREDMVTLEVAEFYDGTVAMTDLPYTVAYAYDSVVAMPDGGRGWVWWVFGSVLLLTGTAAFAVSVKKGVVGLPAGMKNKDG